VRIAALYDIHGNLPALEAVLADLEATRVDVIVIGGDIVMGPMPRQTLDRLTTLGDRARFIRGNADRELDRGTADDPINPGVRARQTAWVAEQLTAEQRHFLRTLPLTVELEVEDLGPTLFCHATPRSDEEIITRLTPDDRLRPILAGVEASVVVCGHTHMQFDRTVTTAEGRDIRVINSGSVGMPYEGHHGAYWARLGPGVDLKRTAYDIEGAARAIIDTGFRGADAIVRDHLLNPRIPDEAAAFFEDLARQRAQTPT
jgi:putative phosphoesterase